MSLKLNEFFAVLVVGNVFLSFDNQWANFTIKLDNPKNIEVKALGVGCPNESLMIEGKTITKKYVIEIEQNTNEYSAYFGLNNQKNTSFNVYDIKTDKGWQGATLSNNKLNLIQIPKEEFYYKISNKSITFNYGNNITNFSMEAIQEKNVVVNIDGSKATFNTLWNPDKYSSTSISIAYLFISFDYKEYHLERCVSFDYSLAKYESIDSIFENIRFNWSHGYLLTNES